MGEGGGEDRDQSCRNSTGKGEGRRATRVVGSCARGVWAIWRTGVNDSTPSLPSHPRHRHSTRGAEARKESEGRRNARVAVFRGLSSLTLEQRPPRRE